MKKQIAILGSTGSIGTQALQVIEEHPDLYEVYCLTANNRVEELAQQARRFKPAAVVIANEAHYDELKTALADCPDINIYAGKQAIDEIVTAGPIDMVLTAMVGFAGLSPTIQAIKAHKKICLANKETLVVAGAHRFRRSVPHILQGAARPCDKGRRPASSHMGHGCKDYHRQRHYDEQGF